MALLETWLRPFFGQIVSQVSIAVNLALLGAFLSLNVRRVHDVGKSTWFILFNLVFGFLILIFVPFIPGEKGPNRFGPEPVLRIPKSEKKPRKVRIEPQEPSTPEQPIRSNQTVVRRRRS